MCIHESETGRAESPSPGPITPWIAPTAPPDAWPGATASPEVAQLRADGVGNPARLFESLHFRHFRDLEALASNTQRAYDSGPSRAN